MLEKIVLLLAMLWGASAIPILIYVFVKTSREAKKRGLPYHTAWGGVIPVLYWFFVRKQSNEEAKRTMRRWQLIGVVVMLASCLLLLAGSVEWLASVIRDPNMLRRDPVALSLLVFLGLIGLTSVWLGILVRRLVRGSSKQ